MSAEQTPDIETAIAEVLAEHEDPPGWVDAPGGIGGGDLAYQCSCGDVSPVLAHVWIDLPHTEAAAKWHRAHVAQALAPVLAAAVRDAKAEVLREVANDQEFWLLDAMDGERLYVDCGHLGHPSGVVGISEARPTDLSRWVAQHLAERADRVAEPQHEAGGSQ